MFIYFNIFVDTHMQRGRNIDNQGETYQGVDQRGHMGEVTYQEQVGSGGKYDTPGVTRGTPVRKN